LVKLQADLKKFEEAGTQVIAISYDPVEVLSKFADEKKITFPLLSDAESKTIKAFGILNVDAKGKAEGVPNPGTFVIDKEGVIRAKLFGNIFKRHTNEELLKAVQEVK
jgi:peroxiredoxin